jgi:hypothetical protein
MPLSALFLAHKKKPTASSLNQPGFFCLHTLSHQTSFSLFFSFFSRSSSAMGDEMVQTPAQVLYALTDRAVNRRKLLIGKGSQARVFSLDASIIVQHTTVPSVVKQYLVPYKDEEEDEESEGAEAVDNDNEEEEEEKAAALASNEDERMSVKGRGDSDVDDSQIPDPHHIVREPFEHEAFVLQRFQQMYETHSGVPPHTWPFPLFLGASESINDDTVQWATCTTSID